MATQTGMHAAYCIQSPYDGACDQNVSIVVARRVMLWRSDICHPAQMLSCNILHNTQGAIANNSEKSQKPATQVMVTRLHAWRVLIPDMAFLDNGNQTPL